MGNQPTKRLIIDICHPGQVHLFRHLIREWKEKGHEVAVTIKELPVAMQLLKAFDIPYTVIGSKTDSLTGKFFDQFRYNRAVSKVIKKNKAELGLGSSITLSYLSKYTPIHSILTDDDDDGVEPFVSKYVHPFTDVILSPDALRAARKSKRAIFYPGYHELAYLHPKRFQPDTQILERAGIKPGDTYFILRFNAFKAHHDGGHEGLNMEQKQVLIETLRKHGKIFISTEKEIDPAFQQFAISFPPEEMHTFLYHATMFIGDSQTMTSEAAVLGTPAIKCNTFAGLLSVPNEIEHTYDLCYSFQPHQFIAMKEKIEDLMRDPGLKDTWHGKTIKLLQDKIDVTAFFLWFVENWPESRQQVRDEEAFWQSFR